VLLVPGSSFNVPYRNHFRVTLLPEASVLREVFSRIDRVLERRAVTATGQRSAVA
jgi:alanine-synthesizing transaminase